MEHHIVTEPCSKIREIARNAARGNWWRLILGVFIYIMLSFAISFLTGIFAEAVPMYRYFYIDYNYYQINFTSMLMGFVDALLIAPLVIGFNMFILKAFRTKRTAYSDIFKGFTFFPKTVGLYFMVYIRTVAWGMAALIPGVIITLLTYEILATLLFAVIASGLMILASLRYSQSMFILADDREKKILQCIRESKLMMKGNKGKLFCLQLSFIGWILLWALFVAAVLSIFIVTYAISVQFFIFRAYSIIFSVGIIVVIIAAISIIPLSTYMSIASVAFYELLTGNLVVVSQNKLDRPNPPAHEHEDRPEPHYQEQAASPEMASTEAGGQNGSSGSDGRSFYAKEYYNGRYDRRDGDL